MNNGKSIEGRASETERVATVDLVNRQQVYILSCLTVNEGGAVRIFRAADDNLLRMYYLKCPRRRLVSSLRRLVKRHH